MTNEIKILGNGDLGRKKEKKVFFPKGRIVDEKAEQEIILLLKNKSKARDMLIEIYILFKTNLNAFILNI